MVTDYTLRVYRLEIVISASIRANFIMLDKKNSYASFDFKE